MKENLLTRIATWIAIFLSIIILAFLCIYPRATTHKMATYILEELDSAKEALYNYDQATAYKHIYNAHKRLEEKSAPLMMFFDHGAILDIHTELAISLAIVYVGTTSEVIASIEAAISSVEYLDEIEKFGWEELL
ncbi:MAG: DUF4363 family protein [Clostridia bacterium]